MADIRGAFDLEFIEQIEFFRGKTNLPTHYWQDVFKDQHDTAFMVAGVTKADLLNDLRLAVDKAIAQGTGLDEFRKDFRNIVQRHGWTGWTGENWDKGEAWRTRIIWETNLRSSYAAGRYAQLTDPELLARRPWWQYQHADDVKHPRELHEQWANDKLTLRWDHPFWKTHFPPNGFGCGCTVKSLRQPEPNAATEPPDGWDQINPKTGEQPGIDQGWGYTPGASRADELRRIAEGKAARYPEPLKTDFTQAILPVSSSAAKSLTSVDDYIKAGADILTELPTDPAALHTELMQHFSTASGPKTTVRVTGSGADLIREASRLFPDSWITATNAYGSLSAKTAPTRAWYRQSGTHGEIQCRNLHSAIHELTHHLQRALPDLNRLFQEIHNRRTAGAPLKKLKLLTSLNYSNNEVTREDHYIDPYWGKDYSGEAKEVMTMALETVLGGNTDQRHRDSFATLVLKDHEMLELVVGLLLGWRP